MVTLRLTKPCARCLGRESCGTAKREFEATVERLNWIAEAHKIPLPDIDVVLDCQSFKPPGREVTGPA